MEIINSCALSNRSSRYKKKKNDRTSPKLYSEINTNFSKIDKKKYIENQ